MKLDGLKILVKGGGEIATAVAHRLAKSRFTQICLTELSVPTAIRRGVVFSEAICEGEKEVEGVIAKFITSPDAIVHVWEDGKVPILIDPEATAKNILKPDVIIDARMAKRNLGTKISDAPLVIGLGPGFQAGKDVHIIIETNRGHNLGKVIHRGCAEPDTGIPGEIAGASAERVLRAPKTGRFSTEKKIGDYSQSGEVIAIVDDSPVKSSITGIIRGLLRNGANVKEGMKVGDIDPRGNIEYCYLISDKARAVAGGVLEAILERFNV